jgi:hypothetical protein
VRRYEMRARTRTIVLALAALALVALSVAGAGCGSPAEGDKDKGTWETVLSAEVSGKEPVKLNLGTHELGTQVRLAWQLTGPESPPVILTFRLINADYGTGFGYSMTPAHVGFKTDTENAMTIGPLKPGNFTVYFSQRFPPEEGPGYDGTITVYTLM